MNDLQVKEFRRINNLTQSDLAKIAGVSIRAVQSWEQGQRNIPQSVTMLLKAYEEKTTIKILQPEKEIQYWEKINLLLEKENRELATIVKDNNKKLDTLISSHIKLADDSNIIIATLGKVLTNVVMNSVKIEELKNKKVTQQ